MYIPHVCVPDPGNAGDNLQGRLPAHIVTLLHAPGQVTLSQGVVVVITIPGPRAPGRRNFTLRWTVPGATEAIITLASHVTLTEQMTTARENYKYFNP